MSYQDERRQQKITGIKPDNKKKKKWMSPVSEKRKIENDEYKILREQFLKEHPYCECGRDGCRKRSVEVHHSAGRVGKNFLDVSTWKAMSRVCHQWAELNPIEAKEIGVSQNRIK